MDNVRMSRDCGLLSLAMCWPYFQESEKKSCDNESVCGDRNGTIEPYHTVYESAIQMISAGGEEYIAAKSVRSVFSSYVNGSYVAYQRG